MNIHIICPFYRKYLLSTIIYYLEPTGIFWHPVCDPTDIKIFKNNKKNWIKPLLVEPFKPEEQCYRKINDFIEKETIIDNDYYGFMGDDDMYEPGFFNVIREQTAKIIFFSNYRGDTIPADDPSQHPIYPLIIDGPDKIRTCNIGMGMYILKGEILKQTKFDLTCIWDDGHYAEMLKERWPDDFICIPDLFVFGNYFQPGRFTTTKKFLKKTWELPNYE